MQPCEDRIPSLIDAASGELSASARANLNAHLLQCPACRHELAELQRTTKLLEETSRAPDDFSISGFAVRTSAKAESFRDRSARGLWWSVTRGTRIALSLSGTALAASVALFVTSKQAPPPNVVNSTPQATASQSTETWEEYIPEAVRLVHESNGRSATLLAEEPPSLDDGLETLSDEELETLSLTLTQS